MTEQQHAAAIAAAWDAAREAGDAYQRASDRYDRMTHRHGPRRLAAARVAAEQAYADYDAAIGAWYDLAYAGQQEEIAS